MKKLFVLLVLFSFFLGGCLGLEVKKKDNTQEDYLLEELLEKAEEAGGKWSDYGELVAANIVDGDDFLVRDVSDESLGGTGTQKRYSWASVKTDLGSAGFGDITAVLDCASGDCDDLIDAPTAFASTDATPDVSAGAVFITANASGTTITDFDTELTNGKIIFVIVNDANTTFDFTGEGLEGMSNDYLADTGDLLIFVYTTTDNQWHATMFPKEMNVTLGGFTATRSLVSDGSGDAIVSSGVTLEGTVTIDLDTPAKARNAMIINNADSVLDVTLHPAAAGLDVWVYSRYAQVVTIDVDDGVDVILLNGVTVGAGDSIDSPGTVGDYIHLMAIDGTYWITLEQNGVWIDGGP